MPWTGPVAQFPSGFVQRTTVYCYTAHGNVTTATSTNPLSAANTCTRLVDQLGECTQPTRMTTHAEHSNPNTEKLDSSCEVYLSTTLIITITADVRYTSFAILANAFSQEFPEQRRDWRPRSIRRVSIKSFADETSLSPCPPVPLIVTQRATRGSR